MNDFAPPPTPELKSMRIKHTQASVAYNMNHFKDHFADTQKSIKKLASVSPGLAKQHQAKVQGSLNTMLGKMKGGSMASKAPLKTSGSTDGKSNKVGGGGRFQQLRNRGVSPGLAAYIGRRKYGASRMAKMAAAGKKS